MVTHPHPRALEAAARAVWPIIAAAVTGREPPPFDTISDEDREWAEETARAAVEAYLAAELEQGRAMMPRKATEEMTSHGFKARDELQGKSFPRAKLPDAMWTAMFDAAPPAAQEKK